jgi:hypothetical protein
MDILMVQNGSLEPQGDQNKPSALSRAHVRRLREMYRSAGWPCLDLIEAELIAVGCLQRVQVNELRVTDVGLREIAQAAAQERRRGGAEGAHAQLVARVAREMAMAGRVVYTELSLRAGLDASEGGSSKRWPIVRPDVYSLRVTSKAQALEPVVHEIKVSRADLLSDLKRPDKRAAYAYLGAVTYVLKAGIAKAEEVPAECGVMLAHEGHFELVRAPAKHMAPLPFHVWLALARAVPVAGLLDEVQEALQVYSHEDDDDQDEDENHDH